MDAWPFVLLSLLLKVMTMTDVVAAQNRPLEVSSAIQDQFDVGCLSWECKGGVIERNKRAEKRAETSKLKMLQYLKRYDVKVTSTFQPRG